MFLFFFRAHRRTVMKRAYTPYVVIYKHLYNLTNNTKV
jgi:hypothetical protein